jgi:hypothetical protein
MNSDPSQNQKPEAIDTTSSPEPTQQPELQPQDLDKVQGGVTFNPFVITRKVDKSSPVF